MKITRNTVVTVSYIVTDESEQVVGRTDPKRPVVALVGQGYLIPGLEKALEGHSKGDEFVTHIEAKEAFGEINEGLIQTIDRALFGDFPIQVGNAFEADTSSGPRLVVIKEINDNTVVVDGNHPLAGKDLNFMVVVEDVREATEEELAHGHAHVDGVCPSTHQCGCGGHGHGGHGCCGGHGHHHDGEGEGEHECCGGHGHHHHDDAEGEGEHHCCCGGHGHHHHDDAEGEGEHHCGCGGHGHHHHHEGEGEHKCCGGHGHHHDGEGEGAGEHKCGCGGHGHHHH